MAHMLSIKDTIYLVIKECEARNNPSPSKTKLLKLIYLADVFFYRKQRVKLVDINWVYYLYGPWSKKFDDALGSFDIEKNGDFTKISIPFSFPPPKKPTLEQKTAISKSVSRFSKEDLNDILNYVYFETEPMINAQKRGESLDFETIRDEKEFQFEPIVLKPKEKEKLQSKIKDRLKNVKAL